MHATATTTRGPSRVTNCDTFERGTAVQLDLHALLPYIIVNCIMYIQVLLAVS